MKNLSYSGNKRVQATDEEKMHSTHLFGVKDKHTLNICTALVIFRESKADLF